MATRFYCGSTTAADVSPDFGTYDRTSAAVRLKSGITKLSEAFVALVQAADGAANNPPYKILYLQLVTDQLAAQTLLGTGTLSGVFRAAVSNADWAAGGNDGIAFRLAKCASDGTGVTEILSYKISTTPALATLSALTNQQFKNGSTTPVSIGSDVTINANDRLILEVALQERTTNTGRSGRVEYGDNSVSDLADNNTGTDQFAPWWELSQDVTFASAATGQPYTKRTGGIPFMGNRGVW